MMELILTLIRNTANTDYRIKEKEVTSARKGEKKKERKCLYLLGENNIEKKPVDSTNKIDKIQAIQRGVSTHTLFVYALHCTCACVWLFHLLPFLFEYARIFSSSFARHPNKFIASQHNRSILPFRWKLELKREHFFYRSKIIITLHYQIFSSLWVASVCGNSSIERERESERE